MSKLTTILTSVIAAATCWWAAVANAFAQVVPPGGVLVLHDYGKWEDAMYARMLANLLGHFDLPYVVKPITNYQAGDLNAARATFYLGTFSGTASPAAFTNDVFTATNAICWCKYNLGNIGGTNFDSKFGFRFIKNDRSSYSNILYKGETFAKNQTDNLLGLISILNSNLAVVSAIATNVNATNPVPTATIPYVVRGGNFWYVGDCPFKDIAEDEDRYLVFCDLLHDILGINHPERHRAIIRIEDVSPGVYTPPMIGQIADLLYSNSVPFAMGIIPVWIDPLGYWNSGTPGAHRIGDVTDATSAAFVNAIRYATNNGAQLIIHGYTHQYSATNNPGSGVSGDDYEFWRLSYSNPTNFTVALNRPVPEDSVDWVSNRLTLATNEMTQAGLSWVAWETPHYQASALDYRVMATNFPLFFERGLYFADDYDPATNSTHSIKQFFPYLINKDTYGRKLISENLGYYLPNPRGSSPPHLPADIIQTARKNLVVRDGWANGYFHGYLPITNLQAIVTGVKALGYDYVPLVAASPVLSSAVTASPNPISLSFTTEAGIKYYLEYNHSLTVAGWLEYTNLLGRGGITNMTPVPAGSQRFYRLRVE